jgi:hypothetical protein
MEKEYFQRGFLESLYIHMKIWSGPLSDVNYKN